MDIEVKRVVDRCRRYWRLTGVKKRDAEAMSVELEQHLSDAAADGRSNQSVVGGSLIRFAENWAAEVRAPSRWPALRRPAFGPAVVALAGALVAFWAALTIATAEFWFVEIEPSGLSDAAETFSRWDVPNVELWFWTAVSAGLLGLVGALLFTRARVLLGAVAVAVGALLVAFNPHATVAAGLLGATLVWAAIRVGRIHRPNPGMETSTVLATLP